MAEHGAQALIELEIGEPGAICEIADPQRSVEMFLRPPQSRRELARLFRRDAGGLHIARKPDEPQNLARPRIERFLPGQTPAFASAGVEVQFEIAFDRRGAAENSGVLRAVALPERA